MARIDYRHPDTNAEKGVRDNFWKSNVRSIRAPMLGGSAVAGSLEVFVPGALWLRAYAVSLGGARINARMTVIKLRSGEILIHSPCPFDEALTAEVAALGPVAAIIAPGNFHWLHVRSCQQVFPQAVTCICPGVEQRAKELTFDEVLGDEAPALWQGELSQVLLRDRA
ncbi:DUF4336 domain-containing protein [Rhodanobacter ginsengisoli]|uniref:DUF4336 domain-containing protein n=1 Tax=Rhodanobacter ginsengisoli TaxID=418646 RepID=A0ABW0QRR8_9GAMM